MKNDTLMQICDWCYKRNDMVSDITEYLAWKKWNHRIDLYSSLCVLYHPEDGIDILVGIKSIFSQAYGLIFDSSW